GGAVDVLEGAVQRQREEALDDVGRERLAAAEDVPERGEVGRAVVPGGGVQEHAEHGGREVDVRDAAFGDRVEEGGRVAFATDREQVEPARSEEPAVDLGAEDVEEIGRASCREREQLLEEGAVQNTAD